MRRLGVPWVTLQASADAVDLYRGLGFTTMLSYTRYRAGQPSRIA